MSMSRGDAGRQTRAGRSPILPVMHRVPSLPPAARIGRLLRREPVVWLSTVRADGRPHLVPIWFSWDGARLLVASKPDAVKVRNVRVNPQVMLALGEAEDDFDVGLVEAVAELPDAAAAELLPSAHFDKYAAQLAALGLTREEYLATYSQPIVITPTRFLPWHGRTTPSSAAPQPTLVERLFGWLPRPMRRAIA
jgi:PPOX class probable F420-dependent enzyme